MTDESNTVNEVDLNTFFAKQKGVVQKSSHQYIILLKIFTADFGRIMRISEDGRSIKEFDIDRAINRLDQIEAP